MDCRPCYPTKRPLGSRLDITPHPPAPFLLAAIIFTAASNLERDARARLYVNNAHILR